MKKILAFILNDISTNFLVERTFVSLIVSLNQANKTWNFRTISDTIEIVDVDFELRYTEHLPELSPEGIDFIFAIGYNSEVPYALPINENNINSELQLESIKKVLTSQ